MIKNKLKINDTMPKFFNLPGIEGKKYSWSDFLTQKGVVIVFSCNHCPYVKAYEDRMIALQRDYMNKKVQIVAINSNDANNYPDDKFEKMVERAKDKKFNFLYLRDEDQTVAELFGATHTPQFFLFSVENGGNLKLRYNGKMDDNWEHPEEVKEHFLKNAIDSILAGKPVHPEETYSIGCTIKWK
ncbi:MAG: thioredoxin family protein [Ignavibacteriales bacterium]|nr:thioredoxin family protein [Ignavibacteriales bacterium]